VNKGQKQIEIKLVIEDKQSSVPAFLLIVSKKEALKKALFFGLATLFLAAISSFIPLIHFVAVPTLLLLTPVLAFLIFKAYHNQKNVLYNVDPLCPSCKKSIVLPQSYELYPLSQVCSSCHKRLEIKIFSQV